MPKLASLLGFIAYWVLLAIFFGVFYVNGTCQFTLNKSTKGKRLLCTYCQFTVSFTIQPDSLTKESLFKSETSTAEALTSRWRRGLARSRKSDFGRSQSRALWRDGEHLWPLTDSDRTGRRPVGLHSSCQKSAAARRLSAKTTTATVSTSFPKIRNGTAVG